MPSQYRASHWCHPISVSIRPVLGRFGLLSFGIPPYHIPVLNLYGIVHLIPRLYYSKVQCIGVYHLVPSILYYTGIEFRLNREDVSSLSTLNRPLYRTYKHCTSMYRCGVWFWDRKFWSMLIFCAASFYFEHIVALRTCKDYPWIFVNIYILIVGLATLLKCIICFFCWKEVSRDKMYS